jgi:HEPN domain-containing protein
MSSNDDVNLLLKRAEKFRKDSITAYQEGYYDISCFYAEQAVQLKAKAFILKNLGFMPRIHGIRELLSIIYKYTGNENIKNFIDKNRRELKELEEGYTDSWYGFSPYTKEDAEVCLNLMNSIFNLI